MHVENVPADEKVAEALADGFPVVLVIGQSLDSSSLSASGVLAQVQERFGIDASQGWNGFLSHTWSSSDVSWLAERFERSVPSDSVVEVGGFPWSAVFTSSPDQRQTRLFSSRGRQPEEVLSSSSYPRVPRSRSRPPIHYLYGKADQSVADWSMPRSRIEYLRRTQAHVSDLLNRVSETATPRGVVVVSGVNEEKDWLNLDSLLVSMLTDAGPLVIHVGGALVSPVATELRSLGRLVEVDGTLADFVRRVSAICGEENLSVSSPGDPGTITSAVTAISITPAMRLRVEASASIVDDEWTRAPDHLDSDSLEDSFRRFHGGLGGYRYLVEGVARGFAISRDFEEQLNKSISQNLDRLSQVDGTIILYGQSGTGKTVALARQVIEVRKSRQLPVLVATNRLPTFADVEGFCDEVERSGIEATVLICDANLPAYRYRDLSAGLRSRGRRVVLIGTSYESEEYDPADLLRYVRAPADLSRRECEDISALLDRHGSVWRGGAAPAADGENFLAMLYRSISAGRDKITSGLSGEARHWERELRDRARRAPRPRAISSLAQQLVQLGLAQPEDAVFVSNVEQEESGGDAAARLLDYVMVAGRLNCPVPLNLVMRAINSESASLDLEQVAFLFRDLDIFRWKTSGDEGADLLLAPRVQIEAELICSRRLGDVEREIELIVDLIGAAKLGGVDSSAERNFILDLLQKLDREGPRGHAYRSGYLRFADALRDLRLRKAVFDASLMLRESVFRRQAVWSQDGFGRLEEAFADPLPVLEDARATIEEALALIDSGKASASKRTKLNLLSERASIYGYLAVQRAKAEDLDGAWSDYLAARVASSKAIAQSDGYHPIDIALWTSSDMLKSEKLSIERRGEIVAEMYATLDMVDADSLGEGQRVRFQIRRNQVAALARDEVLEEESMSALELLSPATAAFLVARRLVSGFLDGDEILSEKDRRDAEAAADSLRKAIDEKGFEDVKCQRLLLQCLWIARTGQRLLRGDRAPTPGSDGAIRELLSVVRHLNDISGSAVRNQERFLDAVLSWASGDFSSAADVWRRLSHDSDYEDRSRIRRRLILSDAEGNPRVFTGRIESGSSEGTWRLRLVGVNATIPMSHHEFASQDLAIGREVRGVGVAFNYVGPIADPLVRVQRRR